MSTAGFVNKNFSAKSYQQYGKGVYLRDILFGKGREGGVPAQELQCVENQSDIRPIKIKTAIAVGSEGEAITIVLHADNYEGSGAAAVHQVRLRDTILIPARYLAEGQNLDAKYTVTAYAASATLPNDTLTCLPVNVLTDIDTEIPIGTILTVGHNMYAVGEGQPVGKINFPVTFSYTSGLLKETVGMEGEVLSTKMDLPEYNGSRYLINQLTAEAERRLELQEDDLLLNGQRNSNTALVATSQVTGDSNALKSCDGLISLMDQYSMNDFYSDSFGLEHLDNIIDGFISQGTPTSEIAAYVGHGLSKDVSDIMKDYFQAYSGGSDLYDSMKEKLGVSPTTLNHRYVNFYFQQLASFSNPGTVGQIEDGEYVYQHPNMGMFMADSPITVAKFGEESNASIPNLGIGYVGYNGETRGKVMRRRLGMNGVYDNIDVTTDVDGYWLYWLSSPMLYGGAWNQKYLIRKSKSV
ncbi:hypothetical protein JW865_09370 [Candidatus Bathyarchaeota archaeon]|nr:hypothetical protein [Candidatus Bathyarchaeota archaeon]